MIKRILQGGLGSVFALLAVLAGCLAWHAPAADRLGYVLGAVFLLLYACVWWCAEPREG